MVTSDNIQGEKQCILFQIRLPEKNMSMSLFIPFLQYQEIKILLSNLLQTSCNLILRRVTKEGELVFYDKYFDWGCANKWGTIKVDLGNIGSVCNTKLSVSTPLSNTGVENLWAISFLVKNTDCLQTSFWI